MAFVLTELLILLILIGLFLILSAVWPPDSPWAPWWQMPDRVIVSMCKAIKLTSQDVVYDLGCGTGKALCYAAKTYGVKGVGIEIDPIRVAIAKWNIRRFHVSQQITILKKNFFAVDVSEATVIFVYLVPKTLGRLLPKFVKEVSSGTKIISYVYEFPNVKEKKMLKLLSHDPTNNIYIYELLAKPQK